jgi:hypothetical protein
MRGAVMMSHKYKIGQTVRVVQKTYEAAPKGSFRVVRTLPTEHGVRQYRIQSTTDGHERVVSEAELD